MKRLLVKKLFTISTALFIISQISFSQFKDVDFLRSASADGVKYLQAYVSPYANAFGSGLSGGWYNTAKPHKFGGFDITLSTSVGIVPTSAQTFDASKIGLSTSITGAGISSTVAGPDKAGPLMSYHAGTITLASFNAPKGMDWRYIPVPTAQIGIGLPFGTELKFRYIPKIKINKGDVSLWGVGILHSLMQYIPGHKLTPFDVSLFAGFTKLQSNVPLGLEPDASVGPPAYVNYNLATSFDNQNLNVIVQSLNISAIGSVNLKIITFYGGVGYCKTQTTMKLSGNFPTPTPIATAPFVQYNDLGVKKGSDFPSIDIKNFSGLRANIGFRLKLAIVTIHFDYTRAQYNVLTTGLGFSFR